MQTEEQTAQKRERKMPPTRVLALGFAVMILMGALLLRLPISWAKGQSLSFLDALFTATSATCVTGLSVVETGLFFSRFGQTVILLLIQAGGLGFMTMASLVFMVMGRRITLRERMLIKESLNEDRLSGMVRLVRWALAMSFCVELAGAVLLSFRFVPAYGWSDGLFFSLFHAVSAFCNAGFDLLGQGSSMTPYAGDWLVNLTLMMLITVGGLGYGVVHEMVRKRRFSKLGLHSRLVLLSTLWLTVIGFVGILMLEWSNPATLGDKAPGDKLLGAMFQSVTLRTAGFATMDQGAMSPAAKLLSCILMFIGASPASTGGGIKTTTFVVAALWAFKVSQGHERVVMMKRALPKTLVRRAAVVLLIGMGLVMADILILSIAEQGHTADTLDVMFEAVSAFATVGLSCSVTPNLSPMGKMVIILTMFVGRVGPLTLTMAIARRQSRMSERIKYPEERIMIG